MYDFSGIRDVLVKVKDHIEGQIETETASMEEIAQAFLAQHNAQKMISIPVEERRRLRKEMSKERQEKRLKTIHES